MRRCRKIQKDMDRYLDGELPPEKIHAFEEHLRSCGRCRKALEEKRQQRSLRILGLIPDEVPITTEEILTAIPDILRETVPEGDVIPLPSPGWWSRVRAFAFRPAPAIAFALCVIALGLSFFLPFSPRNKRERGVIIEKIESATSVMIFQPEHTDTTLIWIVSPEETKEAT